MDVILLAARLLLAAVFVVSGVAKLADVAGTRQSMINLGVPAALARPLVILAPLAELVIAASLIPVASAWYGALGALILLGLFSLMVAVNLVRGNTASCHCFGRLHTTPISIWTLARNMALIAVAGVVLGSGWESPGRSASALVSYVPPIEVAILVGAVGLAALAIQGSLIQQLRRQNQRLAARLDILESRIAPASGTSQELNEVTLLPQASEAQPQGIGRPGSGYMRPSMRQVQPGHSEG